MRSPFDLIATVPRGAGQRRHRVARRRPGRRVRRDARRRVGEHEPKRRHDGDGVPDAVAGSHHRVLGRDQRLQAGVRSGRRRRDYVRLEVGHERPARVGLRVPPQRRARHERVLRADQGHLQAERFRRLARRARAHSAASTTARTARSSSRRTRASATGRAATPRSAACRRPRCGTAISPTGSNRQRPADHHLRSGDDAAEPERDGLHPRSVPEQQDSAGALQHGRQAVHRAGAIGARAQSSGAASRDVRIREQQLRLRGQEHDRNDEQVQPEDRSHAQQHAIASRTCSTAPTISLEAGPERSDRTAGAVQRLPADHVRRRSPSRELGLGRRARW